MRICWAQYTMWAVIVILGILSMLSGCGAKGDLYLPREQAASAQKQAMPSARGQDSTPAEQPQQK